MRKRPMLLLACVFLLGILWRCYGGWTIAITFLLLIYFAKPLLMKKQWKRVFLRVMLCVCIFVIGAQRMQSQQSFREAYLGQMEDGDSTGLQGEIFKKEYKNEQYTYYLRECYIALSKQNVPCNYVMVTFASDDYSIGEILILKGKINMFTAASNEGQFDLRAYYRSQKIDFAIMDAEVIDTFGKVNRFQENLYDLKLRFCDAIELVMDQSANAGVLEGMLLGEKNQIDRAQKELYRNAGISHLLAISALHLSIFAMGIYYLLRRCSVALFPRIVLAVVFVESYGRMTGSSVSTQRAVLMFVIMLSALMLSRTYDMLNALGVWLLLTLWKNPFIVGYSGFVFSVCAVLGIGFTVRIMDQEGQGEERSQPADGAEKWSVGIRKSFMSGLWIQLTTLPITAYYYYELPTYAVFLNLIVIPLLSVVLISGGAGAAMGVCCVPLGKILVLPANVILTFYQWLCEWVQLLPFSRIIVGQPSIQRLVVYYLVLICFLLRNSRSGESWEESDRPQQKQRNKGEWFFLVILLGLLYFPSRLGEEIDMLDVGQGDGIFISTDNQKTFFIDGGSSSIKGVGEYRILPFLKSKGVRRIDGWFLSHGDEDHVNGLMEVLASGYPVRQIILSAQMPRDASYHALIDAAEEQGVSVVYMNEGDRICAGKTEFVCIFPGRERKEQGKDSTTQGFKSEVEVNTKNLTDGDSLDRNKLSLCLLYQSRNLSALFAGDISSEEESVLLKSPLLAGDCGETVQIDVYKSSHHGSKYSSSQELLEKLSPKIALISCGRNNRYGHPGEETLERMRKAGTSVYRTDLHGEISIIVNSHAPEEVKVELMRGM